MVIIFNNTKNGFERWYAWHPVLVDNKLVWFEWVYRKGLYGDGMGGVYYIYSFSNEEV